MAVGQSGSAPVGLNRYDEYGVPAATNLGRFQYTGQIWLGELGLYHYKARAYSPALGRFLQTDPVGYEDQFNLYAYVGNDPINVNDPNGQARVAAAGAVCLSNTWCRKGLVVLGAWVASRFVPRRLLPTPTTAGPSVPRPAARAGGNRRGSPQAAPPPSHPSERPQYTVRIQAQGTGLRQEQSVVINETSPIKLGQVLGAVTTVTEGLQGREQRFMSQAAENASNFLVNVAAGGGAPPQTYRSFGNDVEPASEYRIDVEIIRGPINVVPDDL